MAPIVTAAPDDTDTLDPGASARRGPHKQVVTAALGGISTQRLTIQQLSHATRLRASGLPPSEVNGRVSPMAAATEVATYTPAQIRAAYQMPSLPTPGVTPVGMQAAQMGAGQTIYIIAAYHNPNVVAELQAFNERFGLPGCSVQTLSPLTPLPLPPASKTEGCVFSVVYTTYKGTRTSTPPSYDAGWAAEIALDVQWAHATAPMARIVLIEAEDAFPDSISEAIKMANAMGPGVVSMSLGIEEDFSLAKYDSAFNGTGMSYFAAAGDIGGEILWPSVNPKVVAVGGTSLTYTGSGARQEIGWSDTGGGISFFYPAPSYQSSSVPGLVPMARRAVADVGFNADPMTGQYVAIIPPGSSTVDWATLGGTSLATPQWAGLAAIANAQRALAGKSALTSPHSVLYGQIASVPSVYANAFLDVKTGSNGFCSICRAQTGYDALTGIGTPNVTSLLSALTDAGSGTSPTAPVVTGANISGKSGNPLTFTVSVSALNAVTFTLTDAPLGMSISPVGIVSWINPTAGTYNVTVTAKDSKTGLTGQGVYTVTVSAATSPETSVSPPSPGLGQRISIK